MDGSNDGFAAWYEALYGSVVSVLAGTSGDAQVAAESTDEAFTRVLERWERVSATASPTAWVHTTALNVARRRYRRRSFERRILRRTQPEIATVMGVTRGTVSATLRHAYATLRGRLDDDDLETRELDDVPPE